MMFIRVEVIIYIGAALGFNTIKEDFKKGVLGN